MGAVFEVALSNAAVAGIGGVVVFIASRFVHRPALIHCLWIVVLVKLITPPLVRLPVIPGSQVPADVRLQLAANQSEPPGGELQPATDKPTVTSPNIQNPDFGRPYPTKNETAFPRAGEIIARGSSTEDLPLVPPEFPGPTTARSTPQETSLPESQVSSADSLASSPAYVSLGVVLAGVWLCGTIVFLTMSMSRILRFRRLLKFAEPAEDALQQTARDLSNSMGIKHAPQVLVLPGTVSPMLWAFRRKACVLLPEQLLSELSPEAQATVVAHELAHYRRGDHWVRGLELAVSSLFWWHPMVWVAIRELRVAEEECCDAWVVSQLPEQRGTYARTLLQTIAFLTSRPDSLPASAGVLGKGLYRSVELRVRSVMSQTPGGGVRMSPVMRIGLVAFALFMLPLVPVTGEDTEAGGPGRVATTAPRPGTNEPTSFAGSLPTFGTICNVAVSPDDKLLVVGHGNFGGPGALSVWDLEKSRLVNSFAEDRRISSIQFAPDGKSFAYATFDNYVRIRNRESLATVREFTGFDFWNVEVAYSPDGRYFATGQHDLKIYDTKTWEPLGVELEADPDLNKQTFFIKGIAFSPDNGLVVAAGGNHVGDDKYGRSVIWDTKTGKIVAAVKHTARVYAMSPAPDAKSYVVGCEDGRVQACDLQTGESKWINRYRGTPLYDVHWSADGNQVVAAGAIRSYATFDSRTGQMLKTFGPVPEQKIQNNTCRFTPDNSKIITGGFDRRVTVWDAKTLEVLQTFPSSSATQSSEQPIQTVACSPDGRWIAVGREDAAIELRTTDQEGIAKQLAGHRDVVSDLAFAKDGTLASAGYDQTIKLWDVATGKELRTLTGHDNWVFGIAFSPDGKTLASAGYDKTIRLWNVATGEQTAVIEGHTAAVRDVAFSPDGKLLASASSDQTVKVWNVATQAEVAVLKGHAGSVRSVAFSPDGKLLASGAEDNTARLWNTADWKPLHELPGHEGMIWSVAFSAGSQNLATGSFDQTVKIWDPASGELRQTLKGHRDVVSSVTFTPDTSALVSGSLDRTLRIWRADQ